MSVLSNSNLAPFRQYADAEVIQLYSADFTGQAGLLVSLQPANQTPANSAGAYTTSAPLQAFTNVGNYAYNNPRKVRPCAADDNRFTVVGISLYTVATVDENGIPLRGQPYNQTLERGFVQTGFTVPVLARGIVTLSSNQINGTPSAGDFGVAGSNGQIRSVTNSATNANLYIPSGLPVGKFISSSGVGFGGQMPGFWQFKLEL